MSDHFITFLSLTTDEDEAAALIDSQVSWLVAQQIITPASEHDSFMGAYHAGPKFSDPNDRSPFTPGGLRVSTGWCIEHNMDGFEAPPCPRCKHHDPDDSELVALLTDTWWPSRVEPRARCRKCGFEDLLGNWVHPFFGYCAYASMSFVNWRGGLTDGFERLLLEQLGLRSRVLYVHV